MKLNKLILVAIFICSVAKAEMAQYPVFTELNTVNSSADIAFVIDTSVSLQKRAYSYPINIFHITNWGRLLQLADQCSSYWGGVTCYNEHKKFFAYNGFGHDKWDNVKFLLPNSTIWSSWHYGSDNSVDYKPNMLYKPWPTYLPNGEYSEFTSATNEDTRKQALQEVNLYHGYVRDTITDPRTIFGDNYEWDYNFKRIINKTMANLGLSYEGAKTNFLNWTVYASSRRKSLAYGTLTAFKQIPESFRLAYSHGETKVFNEFGSDYPGVKTIDWNYKLDTQENGLHLFTGAHKKGFYDWMPIMTAAFGSPIIDDLSYATEYLIRKKQYELTNNGLASKMCRKPFILYVTDFLPTRSRHKKSLIEIKKQILGRNYTGVGYDIQPFIVVHNNSLAKHLNDNKLELTEIKNIPDSNQFYDEAENVLDTLKGTNPKFLSSQNTKTYEDSIIKMVEEIRKALDKKAGITLSNKENKAVSTNKLSYITSYDLPFLSGNIKAFKEGTTETVWDAVNIWDIKSPVFTLENKSQKQVKINSTLPGISKDQVNYILGDRSQEVEDNEQAIVRPPASSEVKKFRKRRQILGSIVNSNLLYIDNQIFEASRIYDLNISIDQQQSLATAQETADENKIKLVTVGANDGMLHSFNAENGQRISSFIPPSLFTKLKDYTKFDYQHQYFVDGKNTAINYYDNGWQRAIVGTTGAGSKAVYMLGVDLASNSPITAKWEISDTKPDFNNLGYVLSSVDFGTYKGDGSPRQVVVFGNGYDSNTGAASLFIVDIKTGAVIKEIIVADNNGHNGLSSVRLVKGVNGVIIGAYAGDLKGNLWKFDLTKNTVTKLFTTHDNRPITSAPIVTENKFGGLQVMFGTGKLFELSDKIYKGKNYLYGIRDQSAFTEKPSIEIKKEQLKQRILGKESKGTGNATDKTFYPITGDKFEYDDNNQGWYLKLEIDADERVIFDPRIKAKGVLFETASIAPKTALSKGDDPCDSVPEGSLSGAVYYFDYLTGLPFKKQVFDINGDGEFNKDNKLEIGATKLGEIGTIRGELAKTDSRKEIIKGENGAPDTEIIKDVHGYFTVNNPDGLKIYDGDDDPPLPPTPIQITVKEHSWTYITK